MLRGRAPLTGFLDSPSLARRARVTLIIDSANSRTRERQTFAPVAAAKGHAMYRSK